MRHGSGIAETGPNSEGPVATGWVDFLMRGDWGHRHVMLSVSDIGVGMLAKTETRVFRPGCEIR
jgi:hypothetical protein